MSALPPDSAAGPDRLGDRAALTEHVQAELDRTVRARMQSHYGDVEIADITDDGEVVLRFTGFCVACPLRPMTYLGLVAPALERLSGVWKVRVIGLDVPEAAVRRMRDLRNASAATRR